MKNYDLSFYKGWKDLRKSRNKTIMLNVHSRNSQEKFEDIYKKEDFRQSLISSRKIVSYSGFSEHHFGGSIYLTEIKDYLIDENNNLILIIDTSDELIRQYSMDGDIIK